MEKSTAMPDGYTYSCVLNGCVKGGLFREGQQLHGKILKQWSLLENVFVQTNLVNLYSTTGGGYGAVWKLIRSHWWLFLSACAELGALDLGKWIHSSVVETSQFRNEAVLVSLYNALIHMFAKQGYAPKALTIFQQMESWGGNDVRPDGITFLGVLFACSHAGYVNEGYRYFRCMEETWGVEPSIEHYGCMVDMLSRAGLFDEAVALVETMPMKPNEAVWGALLGGCKIHKNVRLASTVAQKLAAELEPDRAAGYFVLLSNLYATDKRWRDVVITRQKMFKMGVKKPPGQSKIEADGTIHNFLSSDITHKHACSVYEMLGLLTSQAKLQGYQPRISGEELIV
ncbi:hypothetical protein RND71_029620 [Anisodus tanguticus]|uniref:Pentatricopeptide repeat-containing protein n=1 Tax=Anisodus tanguticus TaxID=243964 RepID=A0AAE1RG81_9SOLA|nr:hypothetical protein RND71_029620 [Anisodus tanguticus]